MALATLWNVKIVNLVPTSISLPNFTQKLVDLIMEARFIPFDNEDYAEEAASELAETYSEELKKLAKEQ